MSCPSASVTGRSSQESYPARLLPDVWRDNGGVRYVYVPHLANVVLVQLFCVAVVTLRVWLSTVSVRVRVEYALNERREDVREWIFKWGLCFGGFCG
jgi:hypothetical protein